MWNATLFSLVMVQLCAAAPNGAPAYRLTEAFPALHFERPVFVTPAPVTPSTKGLLYVVEQRGIIRVFEAEPTVRKSEVFLDLRARVDASGNEEGLLGLAFAPDFAKSGHFYVNYTAANPDRTVIARYKAGNPRAPLVGQVVLEIPQPFSNHNGGMLAFGPDGKLYIGMGDGGAAGDPYKHGQNFGSLLGKILRLDVTDQKTYAIPADNPWVGKAGVRGEIWALGLRNPWRFSFDQKTGELWAGDVGQGKWEEVLKIQRGDNHGWNTCEGTEVYGSAATCKFGVLPVAVYANPKEGRSITGGYVYRGKKIPGLHGSYLYGDYVSRKIWALSQNAAGGYERRLLLESKQSIASFAEDAQGELLVVGHEGTLFRIDERK